MMKKPIALILALAMCLSVTCAALSEETDSTFDYSAEQERIEELGIPTVDSVAKLKTDADALWEAKDYEAAAEAYATYAKQANWLANILTASMKPFMVLPMMM